MDKQPLLNPMRPDVLVYLSGPITAKDGYSVEDNLASALRVYWDCLRQGFPVFCPHLTSAFPTAWELSWEMWLEYDLAVLARCTHMLMLPRWQRSRGARVEKARAEELQIPIVYSVIGLSLQIIKGDYDAQCLDHADDRAGDSRAGALPDRTVRPDESTF